MVYLFLAGCVDNKLAVLIQTRKKEKLNQGYSNKKSMSYHRIRWFPSSCILLYAISVASKTGVYGFDFKSECYKHLRSIYTP